MHTTERTFEKTVDEAKRSAGVRDLLGGLALIGVGLLMGGSVFTGNADAIDWIFDGLGTFWACKGLYQIFTA